MPKWQHRGALWLGTAAVAGKKFRRLRPSVAAGSAAASPGISVVIPSREGKHLLERALPPVETDLRRSGLAFEIIVVDNGSSDGTADYLRRAHGDARIDEHAAPLSFARAVNRGASLARYSHLCVLNNDMEVAPGFFRALFDVFANDADLFCASAQIFFPDGQRREETGKTALRRPQTLAPDDYPVFCDLPLDGEDSSPVLYGSGGCSLYDLAKFRALGGFDEFYSPAYVEDLDLGYRAWLRGWPSIYVAGAQVLHRHRATTSRFYSEAELARLLEINYARFLLRAVQSPTVFRPYYRHAIARLDRKAPAEFRHLTYLNDVLAAATPAVVSGPFTEQEILDLTGGAVRVFPGTAARATGRRVLISAGSRRPAPGWLEQLARSAEVCFLGYARPRAVPEKSLLNLCRAVILVDGPAGDGPYWAALKEARRRYSMEEVIELEKALE